MFILHEDMNDVKDDKNDELLTKFDLPWRSRLDHLILKVFFKTFRLGLDKIMIIINRCNCKTYVILLWEIIFCRLNNDFNHRVLDFNLLITAVNESKWHICLETSDFSNQKRPITNQKISWNSKSLMNHM